MLQTDREIDIIVYGASGFTGRLVFEYLKKKYLDDVPQIRLAIGGRSKEKLRKVKFDSGLQDDDDKIVKIFVVDAFDKDGLREMCKQTKLIITLVGPYALYGEALLEACVDSGTHYLDLAGETLWLSQQISKLETRAQQSKAMIIPSCGYDSVPSDLNTMLAAKELRQAAGKQIEVGRVTSGAKVGPSCGMSGGTLASLLHIYAGGVSGLRKMMECYVLSPVQGAQKRTTTAWVTKEADLTGGYFMMAPHNEAIVRRSWGILEASLDGNIKKQRYGSQFSYEECLITSGSITAFIVTLVSSFIIGLLVIIPQVRSLLQKIGPQSGTGPDEKTRESGWFQHTTTAHSVDDDVQVRITMSGTKDAGYGWTAMCMAECAMTAIKSHDELPPLAKRGGFLTPATGLGEALVRRLESTRVAKIEKQVLKNKIKKNQ